MEKSQSSPELLCENIHAFSTKFNLPQLAESGFLSMEDMVYRIDFIREELEEFVSATEDGNLEEALDALVDIVYVTIGTAWLMNLPILDAWERIHHSNMQKVRVDDPDDPRSKRKHRFDIVKPEGWIPPDLSDLV